VTKNLYFTSIQTPGLIALGTAHSIIYCCSNDGFDWSKPPFPQALPGVRRVLCYSFSEDLMFLRTLSGIWADLPGTGSRCSMLASSLPARRGKARPQICSVHEPTSSHAQQQTLGQEQKNGLNIQFPSPKYDLRFPCQELMHISSQNCYLWA